MNFLKSIVMMELNSGKTYKYKNIKINKQTNK